MAQYQIPQIVSRYPGNGEWHWLTSPTGKIYDVPCHHTRAPCCRWCLAKVPTSESRYAGVSAK